MLFLLIYDAWQRATDAQLAVCVCEIGRVN